MTKIHKLHNDADYYFNKGVTYSDNGEYTKAIDCFYRAYESDADEDRLETLLEIGACYAMLSQHSSALNCYYKILAIDSKNEMAFVGIISSLIALNKNSEAIYYINYTDSKNIIGEDYDVSVTSRKDFKVVGKYDREATVFVARKLIANGEYAYAKKILEEVPPQSKDYVEALNLIAMIYLGEEKFLSSALVCDTILEKAPTDVNALTTKIVSLHYANNIKERDSVVKDLVAINFEKEQDIKKIATCMQQIKNEEYALKYYKKLSELSPYEKDTNLTLALLYHNVNKNELAHSILVRLAKIYPDCETVRYFAQNLKEEEKFDITPIIPQDEQERRFNEVNDRLSSLKTVERVVNYTKKHKEFYLLLKWLINSPQHKIAGHVASFLAQSQYFHPMIRELLVSPNVSYAVKKSCLPDFLETAQKKNFAMFLQDVLQFFKPHQPKLDVPDVIKSAYWTVYANCAFFTVDFDKQLNTTYKQFAKRILNCSNEEIINVLDENLLSALLAYETRLHPVFYEKKSVCHLFEADEKTFELVVSLYENTEEK